jgi:hypothetical protein
MIVFDDLRNARKEGKALEQQFTLCAMGAEISLFKIVKLDFFFNGNRADIMEQCGREYVLRCLPAYAGRFRDLRRDKSRPHLVLRDERVRQIGYF